MKQNWRCEHNSICMFCFMSGKSTRTIGRGGIAEAPSLPCAPSTKNPCSSRTRQNPCGLLCPRNIFICAFLYCLSNSQAFPLPRLRYFRSRRCGENPNEILSRSLRCRSLSLQKPGGQLLCDDETPKHVGFICDGNSRWAKKRRLPTSAGHLAGANRFVDLLDELREDGIQYCTFFGFSTENWNRPKGEIDAIFQLMEGTARRVRSRLRLDASAFEIRILGDLEDERIPRTLKTTLEELHQVTGSFEEKTANHTSPGKLTVCLAINYGGRQDILRASQKIADAVVKGEILTPDITEDLFASYLSTAGIPDPDLIIRTSGESRLSNFLLWNCAYSEIFVSPAFWPDFDQESWKEALSWYQQRQRRYGSRFETNRTKPYEISRAI